MRERRITFGAARTELLVLNEAVEHLRLHEDPQEPAHAAGGHGLPEGVSLEDTLAAGRVRHKEREVANRLQEEADERLRHHTVQGVTVCRR